MPKISKSLVDKLRAAKADNTVFDGGVPGFGAHARPSGHCSFILQYRFGGRTRKLTLGSYGRITVEQARRMALQALALIDRGEDPAGMRDEDRKALTVADLAERYLSEYLSEKRKPSTVKEFRRTIEREILPRLGHRRVTDLTLADADALHRALKASPIQANRTIAVLSSMLMRAEKWGLRPFGSNPCSHVDRYRENKRERFLSPAELERLGEALRQSEGAQHPSALLAIRLLALTGMRRGEVLTLKWGYVDFDKGLLLLPDSKTGRKPVPVAAPALKLLSEAPRMEGNPYVCFGVRPASSFVGLQKVWERVRSLAGLDEVRMHDLRHTYASFGAAAGLNLFLIGKILGHSQASTTQRYAHLADDPVRAASDSISAEISASLDRKSATTSLSKIGPRVVR
jgi:integrase